MNICFISNSDRPDLYRHTFSALEKYCAKHQYKLDLYFENLAPDRHIAWSKILILKNAIVRHVDFELFVWVDDDILITNQTIPFEFFLDKFGFSRTDCSEDMMVSADAQDCTPLNTGIIIVKRSASDFLDQIWAQAVILGNHNQRNWEQDALIHLVSKFDQLKSRLLIIPHREIQSFYRNFLVPLGRHWSCGDFAAHVTGMDLETRIIIIQNLIQQSQQNPN